MFAEYRAKELPARDTTLEPCPLRGRLSTIVNGQDLPPVSSRTRLVAAPSRRDWLPDAYGRRHATRRGSNPKF